MKRWLLALLFAATAGCLDMPNPQSEWTTSEGGEQRSTLEDPTLIAASRLAMPPMSAAPDIDTRVHLHFHDHDRVHVASAHVSHSGHRR